MLTQLKIKRYFSKIAFKIVLKHWLIEFVCTYLGPCMPCSACGDQRTTCRTQFSPSVLWVLGNKLGSSDLEASTLSIEPPGWLRTIFICLCQLDSFVHTNTISLLPHTLICQDKNLLSLDSMGVLWTFHQNLGWHRASCLDISYNALTLLGYANHFREWPWGLEGKQVKWKSSEVIPHWSW